MTGWLRDSITSRHDVKMKAPVWGKNSSRLSVWLVKAELRGQARNFESDVQELRDMSLMFCFLGDVHLIPALAGTQKLGKL